MSNEYNEIPHLHYSSKGKRYCEECGQPLIEKQFQPAPRIPGSISLPEFRTRSNVRSALVSEGVFSKTINFTATGLIKSTAIARDRDLDIGQLPKGSIRAHIEVRDVAAIVSPNGSIVTPAILVAFLHFVDSSDKLHVIAPLGYTSLSTMQNLTIYNDTLIVDSQITDGAPASLGSFAVEVVSLALGTITDIDVFIRANLVTQYEV